MYNMIIRNEQKLNFNTTNHFDVVKRTFFFLSVLPEHTSGEGNIWKSNLHYF